MASGGGIQQGRLALPSASSVLPRADVERWFKGARPGEKLIYAHGSELPRGETSAFVRDLYHGGLADLVQPRSPSGGGFNFTVQKRRTADAVPAVDDADAAMDEILRALKRAANLGQRCPSDKELAQIAGLPTRDRAAWRIRKLVLAGVIRTNVEDGPDGPWRTVTIVETKKQTLLPPALRAAARSVRGRGA